MINCVADFAPEGDESGVGLAFQDDDGCFLFFVAGTGDMVACPREDSFMEALVVTGREVRIG
jgi:hypothetical protein